MDQGKEGYEEFKNKAEKYVNDKEKAEELLDDALKKAENDKGPINKFWDELQLFFSIIKDWKDGKYKDIPVGTLTMIFVAVLYFVVPTDLVPDVIPLGGFVDDAAVIAYVIKQIRSDLNAYKKWKDENLKNSNNDEDKKR